MPLATKEAKAIPKPNPITVEYKGVTPDQALFKIDTDLLTQKLTEMGVKLGKLNITINQNSNPDSYGFFNALTGNIELNHALILDEARDLLAHFQHNFAENPQTVKVEDTRSQAKRIFDSLVSRIDLSLIIQRKFDLEVKKPVFVGNPQRRSEYIEKIRNGTLSPDLTPEEQKQRGIEFLGRLLERAYKRNIADTLGHEIQHKADLPVAIRNLILYLTTGTTSLVLLTEIIQKYQLSTVSLPTAIAITATSITAALASAVPGIRNEEKRAHQAGADNMKIFAECIEINQDVYQKEVVDKVKIQ